LHHDLEAMLEQVREEDRLAAEAAAAAIDAVDAEVSYEEEPMSDADNDDGSDVEIDTASIPLPLSESEPIGNTHSPNELEDRLAAKMAVTYASPAPEADLEIVAQPDLSLDPDSFHAPSYKPTLQQMARRYVAEEAPITFKRLSDLIARDHGFQRTGGKISSTIWQAVERIAPRTRSADDHWIFWPEAVESSDVLPFRGLEVSGRPRQWKEVPLPEKLGLIEKTLVLAPADVAESVANVLGYGRVTQSFRADITQLVERLRQGASDHGKEDDGAM